MKDKKTKRNVTAKPVSIGPLSIGNKKQLLIVAGPCVIESERSAFFHAKKLKEIFKELKTPFIFKASYDKANRTSTNSFRGPGLKEGLRILARIKSELNIPILTDIHSPHEAEQAGDVVDVLQVPAFLCRQTDLLIACAKTHRVVNVKKGQFLAPEDMVHVVEKIRRAGNHRVVLTERGVSFGYRTLVSDMRSVVLMREIGCPVIYDATHSVQRPGGLGEKSGGDSRMAPFLASAAVAVGADGVFMEVHQNPAKALSDGPNSIRLNLVKDVVKKLIRIKKAAENVH